MPPVMIGDANCSEVRVGDMGIKTICIGDSEIYTRPGGYLYIELYSEMEE